MKMVKIFLLVRFREFVWLEHSIENLNFNLDEPTSNLDQKKHKIID